MRKFLAEDQAQLDKKHSKYSPKAKPSSPNGKNARPSRWAFTLKFPCYNMRKTSTELYSSYAYYYG